MKESFTKQEIREVIQEIIGDYWQLFQKTLQKPLFNISKKKARFHTSNKEANPSDRQSTTSPFRDTQKLLKKKKISRKDDDIEDQLYSEITKWVDDMLDPDTGEYIGPNLTGRNYSHYFQKGNIIRRNPAEDITIKDIEKMMEWNEDYAFDAGMNIQDVSAFNTKIWDHYRHHKPSKYLGSFPT